MIAAATAAAVEIIWQIHSMSNPLYVSAIDGSRLCLASVMYALSERIVSAVWDRLGRLMSPVGPNEDYYESLGNTMNP